MDIETELHPRPLSDLQEYEKTRLLGAGGFGKVYLVKHTKTRVKCAAKEQKTSKYSREEALIIKKLENHEVSLYQFSYIDSSNIVLHTFYVFILCSFIHFFNF